MNQRYHAYCAAHGKSADEMRAYDLIRYPGGDMCGFIHWIHYELSWWRQLNEKVGCPLSQQDHDDFDASLAARVSDFPA